MDELKPCPFCGGKAEFQRFANPKNFYSVRCTVCGCSTDGYRQNKAEGTDSENKNANAKVWNRRAAPGNTFTNFDHIAASPESLAKLLQDLSNISFDNVFCHAQCDDDDNCPHELQCIVDWLNQPYKERK